MMPLHSTLRRSAAFALAAALLFMACARAPSPALALGPVDMVTVGLPGDGAAAPASFQSRDLERIRALLAIVQSPADWDGTWHTFPGGKVRIGFVSEDSLLGVAWFGESYLLVRAGEVTKMRSITRVEYDSLMALTVFWPPSVGDYATFDTLSGPPAQVDLSGLPDTPLIRRTLLRTDAADLAGHFALVTWGCGTACTSHLILDLETGHPYADTLLEMNCDEVVRERASALVIVRSDGRGEGCPVHLPRFLEWEGSRFKELPTPWVLDDTLAVMTQRPAADRALEGEGSTLIREHEAASSAHKLVVTLAAQLASGAIVPIRDAENPPEDAEMVYGVERDSAGRTLMAWEAPVSQSGDGVIIVTHHFDSLGRTVAVVQYGGYVTGCLVGASDSTEGDPVSAGETATWIFDTNGATIAKSYRRVGGEDQRDLTHEENCNTSYQIMADKYRTASAWLAGTGLRTLRASSR